MPIEAALTRRHAILTGGRRKGPACSAQRHREDADRPLRRFTLHVQANAGQGGRDTRVRPLSPQIFQIRRGLEPRGHTELTERLRRTEDPIGLKFVFSIASVSQRLRVCANNRLMPIRKYLEAVQNTALGRKDEGCPVRRERAGRSTLSGRSVSLNVKSTLRSRGRCGQCPGFPPNSNTRHNSDSRLPPATPSE